MKKQIIISGVKRESLLLKVILCIYFSNYTYNIILRYVLAVLFISYRVSISIVMIHLELVRCFCEIVGMCLKFMEVIDIQCSWKLNEVFYFLMELVL